MKKSCQLGALCVLALSWTAPASSAVIDAYFGANYISAGNGIYDFAIPEAELIDITYIGGGGTEYTQEMPAADGYSANTGNPYVGLPDGPDSITFGYSGFGCTYSTGCGDGESTRTGGETVQINWDTNGT